MNIDELRQKVDNIIPLLEVVQAELNEVEVKRKALENMGYTISDRDRRLNERDLALTQRERQIESEKKFIEEQNKNAQITLNKIVLEKKELADSLIQKKEADEARVALVEEKKAYAVSRAEFDKFTSDKLTFEQERQLFGKEKLAMTESQKLMAIREQNIRAKEEKLDRIDRMTAI